MENITDIRIFKNHLSDGELKKVGQIACKSQYTDKEIRFVLSMAARSIKRFAKSLPSLSNVEIKDDGMNYVITGQMMLI